MADERRLDLVLTTGTTWRPATYPPGDALVHRLRGTGIPEAMRAASLLKTPRRDDLAGRRGVRGRTLVVNLPGSPKGVRECLEVLLACRTPSTCCAARPGDHQRPFPAS